MAEEDISFLLTKNAESSNEPFWSKLEKEILIEEASKRGDVLDGKFKGAQSGKAEKNRAWEEITAAVNAKGVFKKRTVKQTKKQWSNLKQRAKKINSAGRYPATGGGPKPPSPSPMDEAMLSFLSGRPSLEGIDGGFDTPATETVEQPVLQSEPGPSKPVCSTLGAVNGSCLPSTSLTAGSGKKKRTRDTDTIHLEVLEAEKEKIKLEMDYIKLKMQKVSSEIELIELKKNTLKSCNFSLPSLSQFSEF
ncbi:myb/SANT-like DNA-binding domain-containing protein 3 [Saccostrea echinata]|uniref:myb/SANT-like DNA-binding domain-containing protein 3 n=1 Tax=Saccostrea echinata TaxID=191078 RepID=UPI002A835139|nr:myb/SANT-like DNA-binding domain-containing protein 3 [Saccostrea echinata]XP_061190993.1 myb/SANT-like DNA-binding domain-containing protein 3 [Saccostrea echinata]